jgi:D-alanine-D-alanine ligase-like ATP-grasp enzyme
MEKDNPPTIQIPEYYSYVTRSIMRLHQQGRLTNVTNINVEPEYGYTTRLEYDDGSYRVTYGNDLGLNTGAASDLAKDKGHSKFLFNSIGVNHPKGKEFLLPWWSEEIKESQLRRGNTSMRTTDHAAGYINSELKYPVYVKPVSGSKGLGVFRVDESSKLQEVFDSYDTERVRVAVIEEAIAMPDYRIVILDGQLISAYQRKPLSVTGDGDRTVAELLRDKQEQFILEGRDTRIDMEDPRIALELGKHGLNMASQLTVQQEYILSSVSNLSAGGTSVDVRHQLAEHWVDLAVYIAKNFNLRLCGVDLACEDITQSGENYSVLEVNAAPGLDHYASSGAEQQKIVDDLYTKVLNAYPHQAA